MPHMIDYRNVRAAVQWTPSRNPLEGVPSQVMRLLATEDGKTFGYGYGPGWSMMFGSERGDVTVEPGQWVVREADGTVLVSDDEPAGDYLGIEGLTAAIRERFGI